MRSTSLLLAATIGLGALTGCGGGGGGSTDISKPTFVKKANAICTKGNAAIAKAAGSLGANPGKDDISSFVTDTLVPNVQGQIDDIRDLGFPKADKDKLEGVFDGAQSTLDKIKDNPESAIGNDDPFAKTNQELHRLRPDGLRLELGGGAGAAGGFDHRTAVVRDARRVDAGREDEAGQ